MDDNQASDYFINVASIIGIVFGLFKISRNKILRMISNVYIEIIRGTPLMVQIFVVYFGIGSAIPGFS
ncbi:MAG: ABC transporter permease subunit [Erysipelotrichaceae bacterium]|nr:ABC transporter permease subunit [Erysipelotrichaceae bacterium]